MRMPRESRISLSVGMIEKSAKKCYVNLMNFLSIAARGPG
jgi:hypothetical protein